MNKLEKYLLIAFIILAGTFLIAQTTKRKSIYKTAWIDTSDENETAWADYDTSSVKIDPTNDSGYLVIYDNNGNDVINVSGTLITLKENLKLNSSGGNLVMIDIYASSHDSMRFVIVNDSTAANDTSAWIGLH